MPAAAVFVVLYTAHLTQKRKKWYDGKCKFYFDSSKVRLLDDEGRPLAERAWQDGMPEVGTTVQFPRFMVELDELESTIESPVRPTPPVRPNIANKRPRPRGLPLSILLRDSKVRLSPRIPPAEYEGIDNQQVGGQSGGIAEGQFAGQRVEQPPASQYADHIHEVNEFAEGQFPSNPVDIQHTGQAGGQRATDRFILQRADGPLSHQSSEYADPFVYEQGTQLGAGGGAQGDQTMFSDSYAERIHSEEHPLDIAEDWERGYPARGGQYIRPAQYAHPARHTRHEQYTLPEQYNLEQHARPEQNTRLEQYTRPEQYTRSEQYTRLVQNTCPEQFIHPEQNAGLEQNTHTEQIYSEDLARNEDRGHTAHTGHTGHTGHTDQYSDHTDYIYSDDAEREWLQPHTYNLPSDLESDVELVDVVDCDRKSVFENMPSDLAATGPWTKEAYLLFSWHPPVVKSEPAL